MLSYNGQNEVFSLSEIKVQKLSLGQYLFKMYTFVPIMF